MGKKKKKKKKEKLGFIAKVDNRPQTKESWKIQTPTVSSKISVSHNPELRLSPYVWAKLTYLRDLGDTEVGAFGISRSDDPLAVIDLFTVKQKTTAATVEFDDIGIADFFEDQVDAGRKPDEFGRIWFHTHPGMSANPSGTDEKTFREKFGKCDWSVMAILGKGGEMTARLQYGTGIKAQFDLKVKIDWSLPFAASDHAAWKAEYDKNIEKREIFLTTHNTYSKHGYMNMPKGIPDWHSTKPYGPLYGTRKFPPSTQFDEAVDYDLYSWASNFAEEEEEELANDEMPEFFWSLRDELEDEPIEERLILLQQLDIQENEIDDYVCYYDRDERLVAVSRDQVDENQIVVFEEEKENA
ncbi:MAG: hypothetical protein DRN26_00130 [Thermoplasmata archaeon]|nr:MAG: hypothetical protein DRN26_00130 [Thermoplasmata archaeon]